MPRLFKVHSYVCSVHILKVYEADGGSRTVYHVYCFHFEGKLLLTPGIWLLSLFVIAIAWRPPPLVFGIELAGLLEDPTTSVGMISWFVGVAMNLAGPVQYLV